MAEKGNNTRQLLIEAGIAEINRAGVANFSVRRVAQACGVSCAAPYKHFKDKREFIAAIIEYVNEQWYQQQEEILSGCGAGARERIVAISVGYVRFLMEKPWFRGILMLRDEEFDNLYHRVRGQLSSRSRQLERDVYAQSGWDEETLKRKTLLSRAMIFGTVFLIDAGELEFSDALVEQVGRIIDREFDLP